MRAMVLDAARRPLRAAEVETPVPGPGQVRVKVEACGVCRTDLHILDGELPHPKLPLIMGHQIVGWVDAVGPDTREYVGATADRVGAAVDRLDAALGRLDTGAPPYRGAPSHPAPPMVGDRVGIPWLGWSDGTCPYCSTGRENLCNQAKFTGYDIDGGYAEYAVVDRRFAFRIPEGYPSVQAAPLLCAGLIGYRSLTLACGGERLGGSAGHAGRDADAGRGERGISDYDPAGAQRLGLYGYGASAHIVTQVARHQGRRVFAFTRPGDVTSQRFALEMGAEWAGDTGQAPPEPLDAAIIFAPAGELVPLALRSLAKGGVVVCAGIHMSDIPSFAYDSLWGERVIRSVANLTRRDGWEFLALAPRVPVHTEVDRFPLEAANEALERLRRGQIRGAAVVVIDDGRG